MTKLEELEKLLIGEKEIFDENFSSWKEFREARNKKPTLNNLKGVQVRTIRMMGNCMQILEYLKELEIISENDIKRKKKLEEGQKLK